MRRLYCLVFAIVGVATVASGQVFDAGEVRVYSDSSLERPYFIDKTSIGTRHFYIVHFNTNGAGGAQFDLQMDTGFTCSYLDETSIFATTGDVLTGITVDYGDCLVGAILLVTVKFYCAGTTEDCTLIWIAPDPASASGEIEAIDCTGLRHTAGGGVMVANPNNSCPITPIEPTTWGSVKALYW